MEQKAFLTVVSTNTWFQTSERGVWNSGAATFRASVGSGGRKRPTLQPSRCRPVLYSIRHKIEDRALRYWVGGITPRTAVWVESRAGGTAVSVVSPPRPTLFSRGDANDVFCVPTGRGSTSRYRVARPTAVRSMSSHWVRLPSSPAHEPPDERGRSSCEPNMSLNRTVTESSSAGTLVPASGHQKHSRSMTEIRQAFFHSACHW